MKVTPAGSVVVVVTVGVGFPVAVTLNVPAVPTVNAVVFALVNAGAAGAAFTVSVKFCVAFGSTLFEAVNVIG